MFAASLDRIDVSAADGDPVSAALDLFDIESPTQRSIVIHGITVGQSSDHGDAQAEDLRVAPIRGYRTTGKGDHADTIGAARCFRGSLGQAERDNSRARRNATHVMDRDVPFSNSLERWFSSGRVGRHALHFDMMRDGLRGSLVEGVVLRNSGAHAMVPHASHGITFHAEREQIHKIEARPGVTEIDLPDGAPVRVDAFVDARALARVLGALKWHARSRWCPGPRSTLRAGRSACAAASTGSVPRSPRIRTRATCLWIGVEEGRR